MSGYFYSEAEIKLFRSLGLDTFPMMSPTQAYKWAVEKAFINRMEGPNVEALRRAVISLDGEGRRLTEKFDKLISY